VTLLTEAALKPEALLAEFEASLTNAGAIVSFSGLVRAEASGEAVSGLFLQAYSPLTENGIEQAIKDAQSRWPLESLKVVHRVGQMVPRDVIVFVAAASAHRRAAFEAADFLMDYLKTEAIFWKKEYGTAGEHWIEPRAEDYGDAKRWIKD